LGVRGMSENLDLFGTPQSPSNKHEAKFWIFHRENPKVYELFCKFSQLLVDRGFQHHSADAVLHRIRWATNVETNDPDFKINNNYSAYFSRLWMRDHPQHDCLFRTRRLLNGETSNKFNRSEAA
jgi:hypothetical protein